MSTTRQQTLVGARRHLVRAAGTVAAVLAAILVYVLAESVFGVEPAVPETFGSRTLRPLELGEVIGAATIACLAGWASLTVLERFTDKAITIWTVAAVVIFLATLPYMPGFSIGTRVTLALTHGALAAVLITVMRRTSRLPG